jgi:PPE-repeat protein
MDFGIYPPEINSGRMYTGPGSGPMLAAAQAWGSLADELYTAASAYQSVVSELTSGSWSGPSSASMTAAAVSYVAWLSSTAAQAEETAAQAAGAAAAYESAFASTVPPPEIATNRALLMTLVATNFFGQNTPAIAATEVQYAEMWAQDAVAMYGYAASSASATALTPFSSPTQNTDPGGTVSQAAAVSQAASTSAGEAQSIVASLPQTFSAVPSTLQGLATAAPAASSSSPTILDLANYLITIFVSVPGSASDFLDVPLGILAGPVDLPYAISSQQVSVHEDHIASGWDGVQPWPGEGAAPAQEFPAIITNSGQSAASAVSAGLGDANAIGGLSVPSGWTVAAPEIRTVALASPLTNAGPAAAAPLEAGSANMFNQMGLAGMSGQAMAGPPAADTNRDSGKPVTHARLTARGPGAASDGEAEVTPAPRTVVTGVAAAIRDIAKLRNQGRLTEEEYNEEKKRLLEISVRHRPLG